MSRSRALQQSWEVLRERSPRGSYARRRAAALTAAGVFFVGLLAVFGLGRLLVLVVAAGIGVAGVAAATQLLRRRRPWRHLRPASRRVVGAFGTAGSRVARPATLDTAAGAARRRLEAAVVVARRNGRELRPPVERLVERVATQARLHLVHGGPVRTDPGRHAVELNAQGTQLRRAGAFEQAARRHEAALQIFRELGDRRAEALTLNNVALAEGRRGDEQTAVARFEEAIEILPDLADREHEAQVTANLGLTLRRHGHDDRAKELLETALEKLEPESPAARRLEGQLRRAS